MKTNQMAVTVSNLSKSFSNGALSWCISKFGIQTETKEALKNISFQVEKGEIFALLGRNGCGKSTLLRTFSTLLTPDEGEVRIFDLDVTTNLQQIRRTVGRVTAEASFWKKLSALENLHYSTLLFCLSWKEMEPWVMEMAARLELDGKELNRPICKLSRGMQQKVAIIRSLMHQPRLLILDEPSTGLDPVARESLWELLRELRDELDLTILLTSHEMKEVAALSDRLCIMKHGEVKYLDESKCERRSCDEVDEIFLTYTEESINEWENVPVLEIVNQE